MYNPLKDISRLFFPEVCPVCGDGLRQGGSFICTRCRWEIPLTGYQTQVDNPAARKFHGHVPIVNACSLFYFVHRSGYRGLVHKFKYRGGWKLAQEMGSWLGAELAQSPLYADIDLIVPVPLHTRRLLSRGYNQSEYIARGISLATGVPMASECVVRNRNNSSQTKRHRSQRWDNVRGIFSVRKPEMLSGRHILLVDDVLTTGATLISCAESILHEAPDCRISIATLAISRSES